MKFSKLSKILTVVLLVSVLAISLIACSTSKDNKDEKQSTDSSISTLMAKDILSKKGVTYKNIWFDSNSDAGKFTSGIFSYPTTYVVDKNGNIVGEPIVGAITEKNQAKTLEKLIDQALQVK